LIGRVSGRLSFPEIKVFEDLSNHNRKNIRIHRDITGLPDLPDYLSERLPPE
jgi:hypothetical protein